MDTTLQRRQCPAWSHKATLKRQVFLLCVLCTVGLILSSMFNIYYGCHTSRAHIKVSQNRESLSASSGLTPSKTVTRELQSDQVTSKNSHTPRVDPSLPPVIKISQTLEMTCPFPELDPFHPSIMKHHRALDALNCSQGIPSLVYLDGNWLKLNSTKANLYNVKIDHCRLTFLQRQNGSDFGVTESPWPDSFTNFIKLPQDYEQFFTVCYFQNVTVSISYFNVIKEKKDTEERCERNYNRHVTENSPKETLSVLLVGVDGLSRQTLIRSMNKTKQFLVHILKAIELVKFNKVGDNTFPNIVPLLSGLSKSEIYSKWPSGKLMDEVDHFFVWNDFRKAGYRTAMVLDRRHITAFHFLRKGWNHPSFDYYNRASLIKSNLDTMSRSSYKHCIGQTPEITFLLDNWLQLTSVFNNTKSKPYFGFSFLNRLTHDLGSRASAADHLYEDFLRTLYSRQVLNNTLLVFFSDHGPRFGMSRHTFSGILESRTPFMFLVFPDWFEKKYPQIMRTVRANQHRLTTMYDLHATLKDVLTFQGTTTAGNLNDKGISLFNEIPLTRMCHHAGIPVEFCMCTNLTNVENSPQLTESLSSSLLAHIVGITNTSRDLCAELILSSVETVASVVEHGVNEENPIYQVIIKTKPNGAVYEGVLEYEVNSRKSKVVGIPVRLNLYKGQSECVDTSVLKPFCYCKGNTTQQITKQHQ